MLARKDTRELIESFHVKYKTYKKTAEVLGVSTSTLRRWRKKNKAPVQQLEKVKQLARKRKIRLTEENRDKEFYSVLKSLEPVLGADYYLLYIKIGAYKNGKLLKVFWVAETISDGKDAEEQMMDYLDALASIGEESDIQYHILNYRIASISVKEDRTKKTKFI